VTHLLAVAFESSERAEEAAVALRALADEGALRVRDAAVATRTEKGVELHQLRALAAGEGVVGGGVVGLLLGLGIGVPLAVAAAGMAAGGGLSLVDRGLPDARMRRLAKELPAGHAALFALVDGADWARVRDGLAPYGGELIASEVAPDVAEALGPP
jgi:uncharacterized membrane protein